MYLHLGSTTIISNKDIVGIFDIDKCTVSKSARSYLSNAQKNGLVFNVSHELPKSFVVCENNRKTEVYICPLSPSTLLKRAYTPLKGMEDNHDD